MTFFEVEQMEEFVYSLERHLDEWLFTRKDMRMALKELDLIDKKLRKAGLPQEYPADVPAFRQLVEDLRHRTAVCRSHLRERLMY